MQSKPRDATNRVSCTSGSDTLAVARPRDLLLVFHRVVKMQHLQKRNKHTFLHISVAYTELFIAAVYVEEPCE